MSLEKLMENKILNEKINDVYEKIKNKDYVEAYDSVRNIIDFINQKFILKKYKLITLKLYILSQKNVVINEIYLKKINKLKSASKP